MSKNSLDNKADKKMQVVNGALHERKNNPNNQAEEFGTLPQSGEKSREDIRDDDEDKPRCTRDGCNVARVMSSTAVNERESQLEELGFRKDKEQMPEDNKGYIEKAEYNAKKYRDKYDAITGTYKDCKVKKHESGFKLKTECDEYYDVKYNNCAIDQVVEIDPKYTYQCTKKRDDAVKTCFDDIVSIKCKQQSDCDKGGIISASVTSDMKFEYTKPDLTIGTIADGYWGGICQTYDRVTEFEIKNKDKVKEFMLTEVGFDDHIWITLNGDTIYVGPYGGEKVEVVNWRVENGKSRLACELKTNWHFGNLNIDLRSKLKEGKNTLFMRVIVSGNGEGWMKIKARQHCCRDEDWEIKRETKCTSEVAP